MPTTEDGRKSHEQLIYSKSVSIYLSLKLNNPVQTHFFIIKVTDLVEAVVFQSSLVLSSMPRVGKILFSEWVKSLTFYLLDLNLVLSLF